MKRALLVALIALASLVFVAGATGASSKPRVLAITFGPDLEINPVTQDYLTSQLSHAQNDHYDAAVILLDTPGGLSTSVKTISQAELASNTPGIVSGPPEAPRAAPAGVWAARGPAPPARPPTTNIASSTPTDPGG